MHRHSQITGFREELKGQQEAANATAAGQAVQLNQAHKHNLNYLDPYKYNFTITGA